MGGHALKQVNNRRYSTNELLLSFSKIKQHFNKSYHNSPLIKNIRLVPFYHGKESHGDLDILVSTYPGVECKSALYSMHDLLHQYGLGGDEVAYTANNICLSTNMHDLQVDFIYTEPAWEEFAYSYYAWNDCGGLLGYQATLLNGYKLGHNGLWKDLKHPDGTYLGTYLLTTNWAEALTFLGYNPKVHATGFNTLTQMYEYVTTGTNFDYHKTLNRPIVTRDKKRTTMAGFLAWLVNQPQLQPATNKTAHLEMFNSQYPGYEVALSEAIFVEDERRSMKKYWNAKIIMDATGLTGPALGKFKTKFQDLWGDDLKMLVKTMPNEELSNYLQTLAAEWGFHD